MTAISITGDSKYKDTKFSKLVCADKDEWSIIIHYGQTEAREDFCIKDGSLVFARDKKDTPFLFIGRVRPNGVNLICARTKDAPAKRQLVIDHSPVNGIEYKTVLDRLPEFAGSGHWKKAALKRMGFELDKGKGKAGNHCSGLNTIKMVDIV